MTIAEEFLGEFDPEMQNTRKMLERFPDGSVDYRPHAKSMTMGQLAGHVVEMVDWGAQTAILDTIDIQPPGTPPMEPAVAKSRAEALVRFDRGVVSAREAIRRVSDERMVQDWTLLQQGQPLFTMPRIAVLKRMILSHIIHHRAQLGVYLRMNDVPVPGMYGPSADESM